MLMPASDDIQTPIHPGEVLRAEFLEPMGISQHRLARDLSVSPMRISQVVRGRRSVTAGTAMRLARYLGTSVEFWMGLQTRYDLEVAADHSSERIACEVTPRDRMSA